MTLQTSFNNLKQWLLEVKRYAQNPDLQRILLGNKADLEKNVTTESAQGFATSNGIQFFETSAKTNMKITEVTPRDSHSFIHNRLSWN